MRTTRQNKAVTLPGLTTSSVSTESMTDCEAVQRTLETLNKSVSQFREADMKGYGLKPISISEASSKETEFGTNR